METHSDPCLPTYMSLVTPPVSPVLTVVAGRRIPHMFQQGGEVSLVWASGRVMAAGNAFPELCKALGISFLMEAGIIGL